jgi:hypothetical protein
MPLIFDGVKVVIPNVESASFLDNPKFGFTNPKDYGKRKGKPKSICLHTRMGVWPQIVVSEVKNRRWDTVGVQRGSADDRTASWHISIDADGSFVCHLDLITVEAYHASQTNPYSIGIEMYQELDGTITVATLDTAVKICNVICNYLGITKQFPSSNAICQEFARPDGKWHSTKKRAYMRGGRSGANYSGVFGHRNLTRNRGKGDPGDIIFDLLEKEGYKRIDVDALPQ